MHRQRFGDVQLQMAVNLTHALFTAHREDGISIVGVLDKGDNGVLAIRQQSAHHALGVNGHINLFTVATDAGDPFKAEVFARLGSESAVLHRRGANDSAASGSDVHCRAVRQIQISTGVVRTRIDGHGTALCGDDACLGCFACVDVQLAVIHGDFSGRGTAVGCNVHCGAVGQVHIAASVVHARVDGYATAAVSGNITHGDTATGCQVRFTAIYHI